MNNDLVDVVLMSFGGQELNMDQMSWEDAVTYQFYLSTLQLPKNGCINSFSTQLKNRAIKLESANSTGFIGGTDIYKQTTPARLTIDTYTLANRHKCPCIDCAKNIRNGKCRDPFVIKHIGKKFFADQYKQKTK